MASKSGPTRSTKRKIVTTGTVVHRPLGKNIPGMANAPKGKMNSTMMS